MGRSRHGIIGPDDPTISYQNNIYIKAAKVVTEFINALEPWKHLNRYTYCHNNPVNFTDPLGLWEEDVHYDLTGFLAEYAGYNENDARAIAAADQACDAGDKDAGYGPGGRGTEASHKWHFTTPERRAQMKEAYQQATGSERLEKLGEYMHAFQDSMGAHENYIEAGQGQHLRDKFAPDKTYYTEPWTDGTGKERHNLEESKKMAYESFKELCKSSGIIKQSEIDARWEKIEETVTKFLETGPRPGRDTTGPVREEKREILDEHKKADPPSNRQASSSGAQVEQKELSAAEREDALKSLGYTQ